MFGRFGHIDHAIAGDEVDSTVEIDQAHDISSFLSVWCRHPVRAPGAEAPCYDNHSDPAKSQHIFETSRIFRFGYDGPVMMQSDVGGLR
ncbi:hypothetical protein DIQ79_20000 [Mycolicibacterium smegmatis]|uniref:Uncharacterized protein n=1 Tax=Mycolicibacterium smegmatis (strain ATCC 700084 / mc(2)155) TaxID=246196 RepID=A0QTY4_MYCS2|nr:hypothetical protein MSMEG_2008 [Mycolicibacterium smegmatis MC2 155]TBM47807.1 hypothetical protein DIQ86_10950 [Mycolicibacterium smegmatis]TBH34131.1 hypothetical protein EYS45_20040 [Mycolicibacterium smegmatis MC2 155]TBM49425.1 hypothetical protein DIQ85_20690 [Mycolicibacterium smegmatis]TBM59441.1 hypothetical protein DIQ83_20750 [Mycolicibacterium smegmatis]